MAVLKRGDNPNSFRLDAPRRFASSFIYAWNLICANLRVLFSLHWLACVLSGVVGCLWLAFRHDVYSCSEIACVALDAAVGAAVLLLWSVMRVRQLVLLTVDETPEEDAYGQRLGFLGACKAVLSVSLPLCFAWLIVFVSGKILFMCNLEWYIVLPSVLLISLAMLAAAGMCQSYMEIHAGKIWHAMWKGIALNARYWGGMAALLVISATLLGLAGFVLFFGEWIIDVAEQNRIVAYTICEDVEIPFYVIILKYVIMFFATGSFSFIQVIWSMPEQVHIRAVVYKDGHRTGQGNSLSKQSESMDASEV